MWAAHDVICDLMDFKRIPLDSRQQRQVIKYLMRQMCDAERSQCKARELVWVLVSVCVCVAVHSNNVFIPM